jgi:predicted aspartyl protease
MTFPVIAGVLVTLIVLIVANEMAFSGRLFDSQTVGTVGSLGVLAAVFGMRVLQQSRGQGSDVLRNVAIWLAIVTALAFGYWLFGEQ